MRAQTETIFKKTTWLIGLRTTVWQVHVWLPGAVLPDPPQEPAKQFTAHIWAPSDFFLRNKNAFYLHAACCNIFAMCLCLCESVLASSVGHNQNHIRNIFKIGAVFLVGPSMKQILAVCEDHPCVTQNGMEVAVEIAVPHPLAQCLQRHAQLCSPQGLLIV